VVGGAAGGEDEVSGAFEFGGGEHLEGEEVRTDGEGARTV
jgi:hypothetical protein